MAMALKSNLVYSGIGSGMIQAPECWSTTNWEPENVTDSWEWEDPTMNACFSRQGEGQLRMHSGDWACSVVTLASSAGASKSGGLSPHHLLGSGTPSGRSISSGVAGDGGEGDMVSVVSTKLVKHEPDENGVTEQVVLGIRSGRQDDGSFVALEHSLSRENEERPDRTQVARGQSDGSNVMSGEGDVGLILGRRAYFEDSAKASSPSGKKQRPLSPTAQQIPRCQVDGCKADLSGCKEYHKRHKVCEIHSKAPKAIAAGLEQRFCQQCSRFHVLKEFDEGKRSCRRRLAGHNQRRRKPLPKTHSLFSLGYPFLDTKLSTPATEGSKPSSFLLPHRGFLLDYALHGYGHSMTRSSPWSLNSGSDTIPTFHVETPMTTSKPYASLDRGGHHHLLEEPLGSLGQGLSLSSSTGGVFGSLEQSSCSQALSGVSGMIDSGRALSLLSSQSWASCPLRDASTPVSVGLSQAADSTLEQLVASSSSSGSSSRGSRFAHYHQQLQLPSGGSSTTNAHQQFDTQFSVQSGVLHSVALNCGLTAPGNGTHHQRQGCSILGGFGGYEESNSMLSLVGGGQNLDQALQSASGFGGPHEGRLTIDLMQMPSVDAHHVPHSTQSNRVSVYSGGFGSLHPFESSSFTSQIL